MSGLSLPPRPDPDSGEPRPPRAPALAGMWGGEHSKGRKTASWNPGRPQRWFEPSSPILELVEGRRRHAMRFVAPYALLSGVGVGLLFGVILLVSSIRNPDYDLVKNVVPLGVITVAVTLAYLGVRYLQHRKHLVMAGATWVGDGEGRAQYVTTYDLARITVLDAPGPQSMLQLTGSNDVTLLLPLGLLEGNPALWDLIYNGLRHSAAVGAEVDPTTRELLNL